MNFNKQDGNQTDRIVFLDRDGTINREVNYLYRKEDLQLLDGVPDAIRMLKDAGFYIVIVTNQAGVARGYYTEADVEILHQYLNQQLQNLCGVQADAFYYCPHHPEHGIGIYRQECRCRKPDTGMFEQAQQRFAVDKKHSWMIGDKLIDTQAGRNFGINTILVGTGYGTAQHRQQEKRRMYDFFAETLVDAARFIIDKETNEHGE
ncbi:MAG: D-glycero-beta-D-manno-heptose 1,7-bisphosphate 7-phosphatase [Lachnospiraceae bacterium]